MLRVALAAAAVAVAPAIQQASIAGAKLGLSQPAYEQQLGKPYAVAELEGNRGRLLFPKKKLTVEFPSNGKADGIVTWNKAYRTAAGIGPCSTAAALTKAYGSSLKPFKFQGKLVAYRMGRLSFRVDGGRFAAVMLSAPSLGIFTLLNATECS
jgi:hypothetical protein